jgi:hypothetical protein
MINRRSLLTGLVSFLAAPAIVRAASLDGLSVLRGVPLVTELPPLEIAPVLREIALGYMITRRSIEHNLLYEPARATNFSLLDYLDDPDQGDPLHDA